MLLQFFRQTMEKDLFSAAAESVDKDDTGLFIELCNRQKAISKLPYFTLKREWKKLKQA